MFTIQPKNFFLNNVSGNVVFIDGFIVEQKIAISEKERSGLNELYPEQGEVIGRFKLQSSVVMTMLIGGIVRAVKFSVDSLCFLACPKGLSLETAKLKHNLNTAVKSLVELLRSCNPLAVEPGMINCPGLKESLDSSEGESFSNPVTENDAVNYSGSALLQEILEKVTLSA